MKTLELTEKNEELHYEWLQKKIEERSTFGKIVMQSEDKGILLDKSGNVIGNIFYCDSKEDTDEYGYKLFDLQDRLVAHTSTKRRIEYLPFENPKKVRDLAMVSMIEEVKKRKKEKGIGR